MRGFFTLLILVYSAVFITLISALAGYIFVEKKVEFQKDWPLSPNLWR